MDLQVATIDEMDAELSRRGIAFSLVVSENTAEESRSEEANYQLHSSLPTPVQQASHFLLGALSVMATMTKDLEDEGDDRAEVCKRWQGVGEVLLNEMLAKAGEWSQTDRLGE
jgi:hypothetical protein